MHDAVRILTDTLYIHHSVSEVPNEEYDLHCHPYYEVFFFMGGDVSYRVEGAEYVLMPGELLLMRPGVFHGVRIFSDRPYERVALHFLSALLTGESASILLSPFHARGACFHTQGYHIEEYLDALLQCADMPKFLCEAALRPRVESLMAQLCLMAQSISFAKPAVPVRDPVRGMIDYVSERLNQPLSLTELAARFFISKNQLNRVFRQATGTTVGDYISHKRIALAQRMMLEGVSATEAASRAGFGDYSNFYRTYRRLNGFAPSDRAALSSGCLP